MTDEEPAQADLPEGGMIVDPNDPESAENALQAAAGTVERDVKVPGIFATQADRLVLVDASTGPPGVDSGFRLVELIYQSEEPWTTLDGEPLPSTVEIFQVPAPLDEPNGERVAGTADGFEVYELVVGVNQAGDPTKTSYTAVSAEETIIMDFTGEQPALEGVVEMLESFEVAASP